MFAMFNQLFAAFTSLFRAVTHAASAFEHLASAGETQAQLYSTKTKLGCEAELIEATSTLERVRANHAKAAGVVAASKAPAVPSVAKPVVKRGPKARSKAAQ